MSIKSISIYSDARPDPKDLAPFFARPKAVSLEGSPDLEIFRILCLYRLALGEEEKIATPRWDLVRTHDGRIIMIAFHEDRPRDLHAYDEGRNALLAVRLHGESLSAENPHQRGLAESAAYLVDFWTAEESVLRKLLTPPF